MATDDCRECGTEISVSETKCPECGYNPQKRLNLFGGLLILIGAPIGFFFYNVVWVVAVLGILMVLGAQAAKPTM